MEQLAPTFTGNERILARIDDLLEDGLGLRIVLQEEEALALDGPGQALGGVEGCIPVRRTLPLVQIRGSLLALLRAPREKALLATLEVGGLGGAFQDVVHQRRVAPVDGQGHVEESADDTRFGDDTVLGGTVAILEVVGHEVGVVDGEVRIPVQRGDDVVAGIVTELVHLSLPVVVAILLAGGIDVVAG